MKKQFYLGCLEEPISKQLHGHLFAVDAARFDHAADAINDLVVFGLLTQSNSDQLRKRLAAKIREAVAHYHSQGIRPGAARKGARK
jgi:hypothetical protein